MKIDGFKVELRYLDGKVTITRLKKNGFFLFCSRFFRNFAG